MTTLAVFGGSFNPPHIAHQMVCLYVLETQPIDGLVIVPAWKHPFDKKLAPYDDRVAMCRLMARPFGARATVSTIEQEIGGPASRTLDTLQALSQRQPGVGFRLVIGADILRDLDKWYRWRDIEALAPPIIVGRPGFPAPSGAPELAQVSSTVVRERAGRGEGLEPFVPRTVVAYITERGLYRT